MRFKFKQQGNISMVEVLIAGLILSIGLVGYAKQWNNSLSSSTDVSTRLNIAAISTNFNSLISAYASSIGTNQSPSAYYQSVQQFAKNLENRINQHITTRGIYTCSNNTPVMTGASAATQNTTNSSILDSLDQVSAVCFQFSMVNSFSETAEDGKNSQGILLKTAATWRDLGSATGQTQTMEIPLMISYPGTY